MPGVKKVLFFKKDNQMDEDRLGGKTKRTIHIYFPFGGLSETTAELADSLVFFKHDKFIISDSDAKLRMPRSIL